MDFLHILKVAPKSGQRPCTIVQGHWPNFVKNEKEYNTCIICHVVVSTHSTGIPEATVYAGQVFYERADLMRFTAARDLNALRQVTY